MLIICVYIALNIDACFRNSLTPAARKIILTFVLKYSTNKKKQTVHCYMWIEW